MSGSTTTPPAPPTAKSENRNAVIATARDLPSLLNTARTMDPQLAESLTPKALLASKTVYGSAVSLVVGWAVTKWGLGWDADTCALVTGILTLGVTAALRTISRSPIGGLFTGGLPPAPAASSPIPKGANQP